MHLDEPFLQRLLASRRVFWAGDHPPLGHLHATSWIYDPARDFRVDALQHGAQEVAFLVERDLGQVKQWPLVLDEALRLLAPGASTLVLRLRQSQFLTVFSLAAFLHQATHGRASLRFQQTTLDGGLLLAFDIAVPDAQAPSLDSIAFTLITDGRRPTQVNRFVDSVLELRGLSHIRHEILICGPEQVLAQLGPRVTAVRLVAQPEQFQAAGWITRKKNLLVQAASAENILVAHDRYELPPDFLERLTIFGPSFAIIVPRQVGADGQRFPDWVTLASAWCWTPAGMLAYGDYHPHGYVNGGLMLAKRSVLLETPWNELLFWNQGEDVELSRRLQAAGRVARLARDIEVRVTDARPGYTHDFKSVPYMADAYVAPGIHVNPGERSTPVLRPGVQVPLAMPGGERALAEHGVAVGPGWVLAEHGAVATEERTEIFLNLGPIGPADLPLRLSADMSGVDHAPRITANGEPLRNPEWRAGEGHWELSARIHEPALPARQAVRLVFQHQRTDGLFRLRAVSAGDALQTSGTTPTQGTLTLGTMLTFGSREGATGRAVLGHGWSTIEPWGVWSDGPVATLVLDLSSPPPILRITLVATAFLGAGQDGTTVSMSLNGLPLGRLVFDGNRQRPRRFEVDVPIDGLPPSDRGRLLLTLQPSAPGGTSNGGVDPRRLGIGLISLGLKPSSRRPASLGADTTHTGRLHAPSIIAAATRRLGERLPGRPAR